MNKTVKAELTFLLLGLSFVILVASYSSWFERSVKNLSGHLRIWVVICLLAIAMLLTVVVFGKEGATALTRVTAGLLLIASVFMVAASGTKNPVTAAAGILILLVERYWIVPRYFKREGEGG